MVANKLIRGGGALLAVLLAASCSAGSDIDDVEDMLVERYLDPLAKAGIAVSIDDACRYAGPVDDPWHLRIELHLDASQQDVADALIAQGMIVRSDRQPMVVQQSSDNTDGWNGALTTERGSSVLALTYNNANSPGASGAVGWAEECPESRS